MMMMLTLLLLLLLISNWINNIKFAITEDTDYSLYINHSFAGIKIKCHFLILFYRISFRKYITEIRRCEKMRARVHQPIDGVHLCLRWTGSFEISPANTLVGMMYIIHKLFDVEMLSYYILHGVS